MMSKTDTPLIMDFGISHLLQSTATMETATTSTKGSIRWMAIELFNGSGQGADETDESDSTVHTTQSDVWAFGMTIYVRVHDKHVHNAFRSESRALQELLSRNVPYHTLKIDAQVIFAVISGKLPELTVESYGWNRRLRSIWDICNNCWNTEPAKRPGMSLVLEQIHHII